MLLEICGCGFDPGRFFGDPARFSHPCALHEDIPTLIPHQSWANLAAKTPKVKLPVVEPPVAPKAKRVVGEKLSTDDKPV